MMSSMTSLDVPTNYRSLGQVTPDEVANLVLSYGDTMLQVYDDYLAFFSEFLVSRVSANADVSNRPSAVKKLTASFSSACDTLILLAKLVSPEVIVSASAEGDGQDSAVPTLTPWLRSLMEACRDRSRPTLTLVALETLLMLVEMSVEPDETKKPDEAWLSLPAVKCRVITPRMVDKVVLTPEFVKVRTSGVSIQPQLWVGKGGGGDVDPSSSHLYF